MLTARQKVAIIVAAVVLISAVATVAVKRQKCKTQPPSSSRETISPTAERQDTKSSASGMQRDATQEEEQPLLRVAGVAPEDATVRENEAAGNTEGKRNRHAGFSNDWWKEGQRIVAMPVGPEQLAAIREKLGMSITEDVYEIIRNPPDYRKRTFPNMVDLLLERWLEKDPSALMGWVISTGDKHRIFDSLSAWARKDLEAAKNFALKYFPATAVSEVVEKSDTVGSLKARIESLSGRLEEGPEVTLGLYHTIYEWSKEQPAEAAQYLTNLGATRRTGNEKENPDNWKLMQYLPMVAEEWAIRDPEAAMAWANTIEDENVRNDAYVTILPCLARKYPGQEIDFGCLPENKRREVICEVVYDWALVDPVAAMKFAASLQDERTRSYSVSDAATLWNLRAPDAAQTWIFGQSDQELRDAALSGIVQNHALYNNLPEAKRLFCNMSEGNQKNVTRSFLVSYGLQYDDRVGEWLAVADEFDSVDVNTVGGWAAGLTGKSKDEIDAFRTWVEKANSDGKITHKNFDSAAKGHQWIMERMDKVQRGEW